MKQNLDYTDIKKNLENIYKTTLDIKKKINEIEQKSKCVDKEKKITSIKTIPAGISLYKIRDKSHIHFINSLRN